MQSLKGKTVRVAGFGAIACTVVSAKIGAPRVTVVMVGDDRRYVVDREDCTPIKRRAYCGQCGQIGCTHDGLER